MPGARFVARSNCRASGCRLHYPFTIVVLQKRKVRTMSREEKAREFVKHHKDGSIWAKGKVVGETPVGYWEWFRKNGTILRSGYFEDGVQVGKWTTYDKHGQPYKVTEMKGASREKSC